MAVSMLKSGGGGRPKMDQAGRKSQSPLGSRRKESGRQLPTKSVRQKPDTTSSGKEHGGKPATRATMLAAGKAADRKPTKVMGRKEPGRQPATKAADPKLAEMLRKEPGRQPSTEILGKEPGRQPARKSVDSKLAGAHSRAAPGREPAAKTAHAKKKLRKKRKSSGCDKPEGVEKLAKKEKKTAPKPSGCQEPGVKVARPTYWVMVKEAITALKQRRGSSQQALAKYLEENYWEGLPENFRKILSRKLKDWSKADGQLTKVKNSYKLK